MEVFDVWRYKLGSRCQLKASTFIRNGLHTCVSSADMTDQLSAAASSILSEKLADRLPKYQESATISQSFLCRPQSCVG
jgi:hypothetical protein